MRLASVLVSSPKFTAEEKRQVPRRNGDKKWPRIWFSQNNEENPTTSQGTMFESQPAPAHCTTCSSYLVYLYLYLYVQWKKIRQNKPTL